MLKYKLDTLEGINEEQAALYEASGDKFILKVEGLDNPDDVSGLKAQLQTLLSEKKEAVKKAADAETAAEEATREAAAKSGDATALNESWKAKFENMVAEKEGTITALNGSVTKMKVESVAAQMADEITISGSAALVAPQILRRLSVERRGDDYVTVVVDAQGQPSATTLDELKQEFVNNPAFAPVIVASKADGGGANGSSGNGGGATKTIKRAQFDQLGSNEKMSYVKDGGSIIE